MDHNLEVRPSGPPGHRRRRGLRGGFTLIELVIVIVVIGLILRFALPGASRSIRVGRVNGAAQVLSADLDRAFSTAARERKPIRLAWDGSAMQYTLTDRASGTTLLTRSLGTAGSTTVSFSASPLDIFPGGFASSALTVTVSEGDYTRHIQMTRAGLTLVGP